MRACEIPTQQCPGLLILVRLCFFSVAEQHDGEKAARWTIVYLTASWESRTHSSTALPWLKWGDRGQPSPSWTSPAFSAKGVETSGAGALVDGKRALNHPRREPSAPCGTCFGWQGSGCPAHTHTAHDDPGPELQPKAVPVQTPSELDTRCPR